MALARIRQGDTVMVISGKDKGKTGKVIRYFPEFDKVIVEGIAIVKKHVRATPTNRESGIVEREAAMPACKVMPVDPETGKGTRVRVRLESDGSKSRLAKSGKVIEAPAVEKRSTLEAAK